MALVDCRAMAERVIDTLAPLNEGLTIELADGPDIELLAEPRYLQRALQNLVGKRLPLWQKTPYYPALERRSAGAY